MPESYSKLSHFFLWGLGLSFSFLSSLPYRPPISSSSFSSLLFSTFFLFFLYPQLLTFHSCHTPFQTQPPTFQRQFDKMQISFVSLTTIGFSAYSLSAASSPRHTFSFFSESAYLKLLLLICVYKDNNNLYF